MKHVDVRKPCFVTNGLDQLAALDRNFGVLALVPLSLAHPLSPSGRGLHGLDPQFDPISF